MPLQSDPTVLYGRSDDDRRITRADLARPTPYNTYTIPGLPPAPIASPGRASLEAAVDPAPVDYLYFVAKGDGTHEFSTTRAAHNTPVARYQKHARSRAVTTRRAAAAAPTTPSRGSRSRAPGRAPASPPPRRARPRRRGGSRSARRRRSCRAR